MHNVMTDMTPFVIAHEDSSRYDFSTDLFTDTTGSFFAAAQNAVFPNPLNAGAA